jgi:hypothetical protein
MAVLDGEIDYEKQTKTYHFYRVRSDNNDIAIGCFDNHTKPRITGRQ